MLLGGVALGLPLAHEAAEIGHGVDEGLIAKSLHGLADGPTCHPELLHELDFGQQMLGWIGAVNDACAKHVGYLLPPGAIWLEVDHSLTIESPVQALSGSSWHAMAWTGVYRRATLPA